jgi:hypothetical protein
MPNRHVVHLRAKWVPVYQYEFNYTGAPYYPTQEEINGVNSYPCGPGRSACALRLG